MANRTEIGCLGVPVIIARIRQAAADADKWRGWIDACANEARKRLTPWEQDFLESISDQLTNRGWLSGRQIEILERIYTEKT